MNPRRGGLGRGLDAIIPNLQPAGVEEVDVDLIAPNPHQPRSVFDQEALNVLAESIREHGVIQPLIVTRPQTPGSAPFQLIAGERRLLASRIAGLRRVPVIVRDVSEQNSMELALVENLQRADLGPLEEAIAFRRLSDEFNMTQEAVATRVGRSRSAVANSLRLLALSDELQTSLASGEITAGHARALLSIEDTSLRRRVWRDVVERGLSVRETEALARQALRPERAPTPPKRPNPDVAALEERLRGVLGTKVELQKGRKGGRVVIHFYSDEELDAIVERLGP